MNILYSNLVIFFALQLGITLNSKKKDMRPLICRIQINECYYVLYALSAYIIHLVLQPLSSLLNLQQIIKDCYHKPEKKCRLGLHILGIFTGFLQSLLYYSYNRSDQSPRAMRYRFVKLDFSSGKRAFQSYISRFLNYL